jgi:hypothetical protein
LLDPLYQRSLAAGVPGTFSSHRQNGAKKASEPFSASGFVHMWGSDLITSLGLVLKCVPPAVDAATFTGAHTV